jgi:ribA/ribD-fused uncharacterized protein
MGDQIVVGEVDWMRNDYNCDISVAGYTYATVEHAYQAAKFKDPDLKQAIQEAETVREARNVGRNNVNIRDDWDDIRATIMESLVRQKFTNNPTLGDRLAKTGSAEIVMEGYDEFWGTGRDGTGENMLGAILETVRSEIQFISGVDPSDYDQDEDEKITEGLLREAILDISKYLKPTDSNEELADACQRLYDGAKMMMTLVDPNDFDASFISRRTGVTSDLANDAISKLRSMQSALNELKDLLSEDRTVSALQPADDSDDDVFDEDDDNPIHPTDDWLSPMD